MFDFSRKYKIVVGLILHCLILCSQLPYSYSNGRLTIKALADSCYIDTAIINLKDVKELEILSCGFNILSKYNFPNCRKIVIHDINQGYRDDIKEYDAKLLLKKLRLDTFSYAGVHAKIGDGIAHSYQGFELRDFEVLSEIKSLRVVEICISSNLKYVPESCFSGNRINSARIYGSSLCHFLLPISVIQKSKIPDDLNLNYSLMSITHHQFSPDELLLILYGAEPAYYDVKRIYKSQDLDKLNGPNKYIGLSKMHRPPRTGVFKLRYSNDQIWVEGAFYNKKPNGEWIFYYSNGQKYSERYYRKGIEDSTWTAFKENGDTLYVLKFKEGNLMYQKSFESSLPFKFESEEVLKYNEEKLPIHIRKTFNKKEVVVEKKGRYWADDEKQDEQIPADEVKIYQYVDIVSFSAQDYISKCITNSKKCIYIKYNTSGEVVSEEVFENGLLVKNNN